ncbi:GlsB/YeaQ/YmgE family stress response membrane protein [candidate division KSB1 bacterium]|nr:GlsB/YeaQ/YmgE family stress response membrane protein [candidate division KSB1 bacterium]
MGLLLFLAIGLAAGWIAGKIMKGKGFGLWGNLLVGIIGAFVGGFLFRLVGLISSGLAGELVMAVVGAVVLLWVIAAVKK